MACRTYRPCLRLWRFLFFLCGATVWGALTGSPSGMVPLPASQVTTPTQADARQAP
jgi:hypothetical protein